MAGEWEADSRWGKRCLLSEKRCGPSGLPFAQIDRFLRSPRRDCAIDHPEAVLFAEVHVVADLLDPIKARGPQAVRRMLDQPLTERCPLCASPMSTYPMKGVQETLERQSSREIVQYPQGLSPLRATITPSQSRKVCASMRAASALPACREQFPAYSARGATVHRPGRWIGSSPDPLPS